MRKTITVLALTLEFLVAFDLAVAGVLRWAEGVGRAGALITYFEYGRSVPGKLARWQAQPGTPGNLFETAWRPEALVASAADFADEAPEAGPVIRSYGLSFVNNILLAAADQDPALILDLHAGPGAPPNYTYAFFEDDRAARREGDVVVFGILSSSVPAMASLSNRSWVFEQPAPVTYPIYRPDGAGLRRIDPVVAGLSDQQTLSEDRDLAQAWTAQLAREDAFYSPVTFGVRWADHSPFLRLARRSLADTYIRDQKARVLEEYPYETVLIRMIETFAATVRADGQVPIVMLIQTRNPRDPDLLSLAQPVLEAADIPYFATAEHADPSQGDLFLPDGHYRPDIDAGFAEVFRAMMQSFRQ